MIDARSEHVAADVSRHVLAISGIKPTSDANVNLSIDIKAGYVIDLSGPGDAKPMKIVSPDPDPPARPAPE